MPKWRWSAGNLVQALQAFDEAAKRGLPNQRAMAMHIELLARAGRFADAATQMERLPEASRQSLLGPLYTDILFRTNQVENALEQARLATEKDPNNAQNYYWYGELLARYSAGAASNGAAAQGGPRQGRRGP